MINAAQITNAFTSTLCFFLNTNKNKTSLASHRIKTPTQWRDITRSKNNNEPLTAPTRNWRFSG